MIILLQIYKTFPIFIDINKEMWLFYIKNRHNHQQIALYHLQAIQVYFIIFLYSFVNSTTFSIICINCIMYFSNLHTSAIELLRVMRPIIGAFPVYPDCSFWGRATPWICLLSYASEFLGAKLNYLRTSQAVQNMPEYVCFSESLEMSYRFPCFYQVLPVTKRSNQGNT